MKRLTVIFIFMILTSVNGAFAADVVKDIPVSQVPLKITTAAKKEIFAIKFTEAEIIEKEGAGVIYELEGVKDGINYVVQVSGEGKVLRSGIEGEFEQERKERNLSKLPPEIREAALKVKEGIKLVDFAVEKEGYGMVTYEVEGIADGECYEIEINVQGDVIETEKCD